MFCIMARYIIFSIICFIILTFLMTAIKGVLRRAMNLTANAKKPISEPTAPTPASSEELYRKNGVVVLKGKTLKQSKD
jgi:hypothetical protein